MADLTGKTVAFLLTDGYEDSELTSPWQAVTRAGAKAVLVSPRAGRVGGKKGHSQAVDVPVAEADVSAYDALMLPGGTANADALRMNGDAVAFTRSFFTEHKPVGVICHGAWILADADVLSGRTLTSFPSLRTDLRNAGATWVDEEVVVDEGLVSSRTPADLPAFNDTFVEEVMEGKHAGQTG
ncbi:type 1 glutamine amidotransferase domain-containing protein [Ruania rhizosphaerae]|uniref:type 1 glutamine amidotransferase domain-containing protein n=1 Tax=Ruania rhizosphaerae TaxID=1840413 RepID=UPI00135B2490|nr:type 1 glutamine amidotransferase domain-containing protein [Ruania rhizosphaerae]